MKEIMETLEKLVDQIRNGDEVETIHVYITQHDFRYTISRKGGANEGKEA